MAYSYETSSVKTLNGEVSGLADVVARQAIANLPTLSAGEGIQIVNEDGKNRIDLGLSAGTNMSFVYDQETNTIRLDAEGGGANYSGIAPIVVNNTTNQISADTWSLSAGYGLVFTDDNVNKVTKLEVEGETLSAGPNIDIFSSGGYVVISATGGGGGGATYNGISPIVVNNNTNQISAKGVPFGVQSPLFFVQDDNEAVVIGCSAGGGGTTYTGDAQGALDEVYTNSGVWLTAHQSLADYQTTAGMTAYYTTAAADTLSSMLSGAIDYVSANAGGTTLTGDAQGALNEVYANSGKWISTTNNDASALFYSNLVTDGNQTFYGPILSAKATNNYYTNLFEIRAGRFTIASEYNYNYVSAYFSPECISSYGNGNLTGGNWDWHLDYRGLGGTFSDNYSNKATWSALRNVDLGLTTGGVVSSISGHGLTIGDVNNIVLTASLPVSPDANTLYLIPEA